MRSKTNLAHRLSRLIWSKSSTSFFLNGAPGSGKSTLLGRLARELTGQIPRSYVLGPYAMKQEDFASLTLNILQDCRKATFLDSFPDETSVPNLVAGWMWFADNAYVSTDHSFLVFVDLVDTDPIDLVRLGNLFSQARELEGIWGHRGIRLFHMFAGYWDHPALERHFRDISTSFPYTPGDNYATWEGVSRSEIKRLVGDVLSIDIDSVYGSTVFELTHGHPAAALDILRAVDQENVSVNALLSATERAAESGPAGEALVDVWRRSPPESRTILKRLMRQRHLPRRLLSDRWEQLATAGAIRSHQVGGDRYVTFKSWYAELLARRNANELGMRHDGTRKLPANALMPTISEINVRAYRLINDIENQARNFVATHLSLKRTNEHILQGRDLRFDEDAECYVDAYERASDWCRRSLDTGVLNPLLAYLSTRDLAHIIAEISAEIGSEAWGAIADAILQVSDIRDAVMHNQLIEAESLERLHELRADIYEALNEC